MKKTNNRKVSVIVPVYNAVSHLDVCISSIINQTYNNLEIILVDDGSTDNTLEKLNEYKEKYPQIKVYTKKNKGVAHTRNYGLSKATGYYIMFMDNDDYIDNNYVEKMVSFDDNSDYDIINSGYVRETYDGKIIFKRQLRDDDVALYIQLACWGKLYKHEYIKNYKFLESKIADDIYFNVLAYNNTDKIKTVSYSGYHWLFNDKSLSNTNNKGLNYTDDLLKVLEKINIDVNHKNDEILNYFYIRTFIYYILFSSKKVSITKIMNEYNKMLEWLQSKNINFKNKYIGVFKKNSEELYVKVAIRMFLVLKKLHLIKPFLFVYSKI